MKYDPILLSSDDMNRFRTDLINMGEEGYHTIGFHAISNSSGVTLYALMEKELPSDPPNNLPKPHPEEPVV
ncbi:MAG: hypothetical protein WC711_01760 [Candidatus Staskawiczbacteria bacterium]|jgi:hypothetical protein